MKTISIALVFLAAALLSLIAAFVSVYGMVQLFAAHATVVACMVGAIEFAKLVGAGWLKAYWGDERISKWIKFYLTLAVGSTMLVTSLGVFGYLSAAHLEQAAPRADLKVQTEQLDLQVQQRNAENERLQQRLQQIDQNIAVFLKNEQASKGLRASKSLQIERDSIQKKLEDNNLQINELQKKLAPLRMQDNAVAAKLGPVKYVAALFGWEDEESAVRLVILILMIGFDPLAVVLMLCGLIMMREYQDEAKAAVETPEKQSALKYFADKPFVSHPIPASYFERPEPEERSLNAVAEADFEPGDEVPVASDPFDLDAQIESYNQNEDKPVLEDYIFPPRANGRGSLVETLPQGESLGDDLAYWQGRMANMLKKPEAEPKKPFKDALSELAETGVFDEVAEEDQATLEDFGFKTPIGEINVSPDISPEVITEAETLWDKIEPEAPVAIGDDEPTEDIIREIDRDTMITILERNPDILKEIEALVEEDVEKELTDREKLLDLLSKNPAIISDMAEIIASQITKQQGDSWLS